MRRVVLVCTDPGVPVFGTKGASAHVQAVARVLVEAGVETHVACVRTGGEVPQDLAGVHVHPLPAVSGAGAAERERSAAAADTAVARVLDTVAADGPVDLVHERYSLWGRTASRWARAAGVPAVLEVNAPLVEEQARYRQLADRLGAERVARTAFGTADAVACVSEPVADWVRRRTRRPERVHVVANGADTRRITPAHRPVAAARGPFTLGFVGTLKAWHGVETLVDALALLVRRDPDHRLLLVGDGPLAGDLRDRARRLGVADHVEATGAVPPAEVPGLLARMDLAVAPYPAHDTFYFSPLKVYEYLAAGLPVVASEVGPLPELLAHGLLGELVPPGSATALAAAVERLRADPVRRTAIRGAATGAAADHDWRVVCARTWGLVGLSLPEVARVG